MSTRVADANQFEVDEAYKQLTIGVRNTALNVVMDMYKAHCASAGASAQKMGGLEFVKECKIIEAYLLEGIDKPTVPAKSNIVPVRGVHGN